MDIEALKAGLVEMATEREEKGHAAVRDGLRDEAHRAGGYIEALRDVALLIVRLSHE